MPTAPPSPYYQHSVQASSFSINNPDNFKEYDLLTNNLSNQSLIQKSATFYLPIPSNNNYLVRPPLESIISQEYPKTNKDLLKQWKQTKPVEELPVKIANQEYVPSLITIFQNVLFTLNESGCGSIFEIDKANKIEQKNNFQISTTKIRSISCNLKYFGLTYSKLNLKQMKRMRVKSSGGILLFQKNNAYFEITIPFEKEISLNNEMKSPFGLALNDEFAFVCDQELKCVYKISILSGELINKIGLIGGDPYKCSILTQIS